MKLVWFSEIKWDYLKTRKQHLLTHLPSSDKILFFQPYGLQGCNHLFPRKINNIIVVTLPTYRRSKSLFIEKAFSSKILRSLFYCLTRMWAWLLIYIIFGRRPDTVLISNMYYIPMIKNAKWRVVWDYNDDPEQFGPQPSWAMDWLHSLLSDQRTVLIACSRNLQQKLAKQYERPVHYVPNGVDMSSFREKSPWRKESLTLGYVGVISKWFFDFALVDKISRSFPGYEIRLYGPVDQNVRDDFRALQMRPNVRCYPSVPYDQLATLLPTFRIGLIPLKSEPGVWQASSAKFLQYLAAGIPVVSVWMDEYSDFRDQVALVRTHDEFILSIREQLKRDIAPKPSDLARYDWANIAKEFYRLLTCDDEKK